MENGKCQELNKQAIRCSTLLQWKTDNMLRVFCDSGSQASAFLPLEPQFIFQPSQKGVRPEVTLSFASTKHLYKYHFKLPLAAAGA